MTVGTVEFVGGPLDGLKHCCTLPERRPAAIRVPLNPSVLAYLAGDAQSEDVSGAATSLAVYRRLDNGAEPRYGYVRSFAAERECSGV